ncbi:Protein soga1 [Saguinus oedipus]|uniref:Protein soga1 n=1 Tax=Saguinus oedipus TaxID=9490 RepID=A0ABQ9VKM2_SAGOE|nr:Protein soga1 [Saguinus oedipus]
MELKAGKGAGERAGPDWKAALQREREEQQHLLAESYSAVMELTRQLQISERNWSQEKLQLVERLQGEKQQVEQQLKELQNRLSQVLWAAEWNLGSGPDQNGVLFTSFAHYRPTLSALAQLQKAADPWVLKHSELEKQDNSWKEFLPVVWNLRRIEPLPTLREKPQTHTRSEKIHDKEAVSEVELGGNGLKSPPPPTAPPLSVPCCAPHPLCPLSLQPHPPSLPLFLPPPHCIRVGKASRYGFSGTHSGAGKLGAVGIQASATKSVSSMSEFESLLDCSPYLAGGDSRGKKLPNNTAFGFVSSEPGDPEKDTKEKPGLSSRDCNHLGALACQDPPGRQMQRSYTAPDKTGIRVYYSPPVARRLGVPVVHDKEGKIIIEPGFLFTTAKPKESAEADGLAESSYGRWLCNFSRQRLDGGSGGSPSAAGPGFPAALHDFEMSGNMSDDMKEITNCVRQAMRSGSLERKVKSTSSQTVGLASVGTQTIRTVSVGLQTDPPRSSLHGKAWSPRSSSLVMAHQSSRGGPYPSWTAARTAAYGTCTRASRMAQPGPAPPPHGTALY